MPGINYTLGMNASSFAAGVQGALGKLASIGAAAAKATTVVGVAGGASIVALINKSIGKAAEIESLETAFIPLLGGVDQARERLQELSQFAAATPFELPEIAQASQTLETLTRGALSTGNGLTLVGDIASGTKQSFSDMAVTVGRLYDGLQSGRPVGEALARLQELGAITGETRAQLENMGGGAEAWAVAEAALGRFSGSMALQSGTWQGLMSNLSGSISLVMAEFGKPIMDSLKPYLEEVTARLDNFKATAARIGAQIGEAFGVIFQAFQGGQLMELAGKSLMLGFREAVDFLQRSMISLASGLSAAIEASGVITSLIAAFNGIGDLLVSKIKLGASDLADALELPGKARDLRKGAAADAMRSDNWFTQASAGLSSMDGSKITTAFTDSFTSAFDNLPEAMGLTDARKEFQDFVKPLRDAAAAAKQEREERLRGLAASVVSPQASGEQAVTAASGGRRPALDRLAQIGGYVGNAVQAKIDSFAQKTEQWTRQSESHLRRIAQHVTGGQRELTF